MEIQRREDENLDDVFLPHRRMHRLRYEDSLQLGHVREKGRCATGIPR